MLLTDILSTDKGEAGVVDRTTGGVPIEWESGIIDISEMSLEELGTLPADDKSPLASSLRRVAEELTDATEQIAGFNSAL